MSRFFMVHCVLLLPPPPRHLLSRHVTVT